MKQIFFTITLLLVCVTLYGQEQPIQPGDIKMYFQEVAAATKKSRGLWNKDLYDSILLVDAQTRRVYANTPDSAGLLKQDGDIYTGILPENQHISNTCIRWNGTDWAMVALPLSENKYDRVSLLIHERFHVVQPELGFVLTGNDGCNHLDSKDGRIYLRLELEALKQAVTSSSKTEMLRHLTAAFVFRRYRQSLFPDAGKQENELELNEGIAEYTGEASCGRLDKQKTAHFTENIDGFMHNPTFVRSFAYQTIPVYGYLLDKSHKGWNKSVNMRTNLADYFINAFGIQLPYDWEAEAFALQRDGNYHSTTIIAEETEREAQARKRVAEYKSLFIEQPHFEIAFEQMKIQFDPRNIMPLEDKGTVYPNIEVIDNWGILHVIGGALMSPNWDKITITCPTNMNGKHLSGKGWTLEMNEGYSVIIVDGNFGLKRD